MSLLSSNKEAPTGKEVPKSKQKSAVKIENINWLINFDRRDSIGAQ